jgi:predicted  nucleic acid-binding Zn-ribbon protein
MPAVSLDAARGAGSRIPLTAEQASFDVARWWTDRVALFASLAQRAHPRGDVPPWLSQALVELDADATRLAELRKQLAHLAQRSAETEQRARDTRLRIGRALDELVSDESRAARALREFEARSESSRSRLAEHGRPLLAAWDALRASTDGGMTLERASALREAGALASGWIEMARADHAVARELAERKREREDLGFQVAQLKGRLGAIQAEAEHELGELRAASARLDAAFTQGGEAITHKAAPVAQHFTRWPALRAALSFGQTQPDAATPAR